MRLIDLHCNWLLQYAREAVLFDPERYPEISERLEQVEGYLQGTAVAVVSCGKKSDDWGPREEAWQVLGDLISRYEAEFSGRLLIGSDDVLRWREEPADGLCWGVLAIEGFDALIHDVDDLTRLEALFARGVRVFQLVETPANALGGAAEESDRRGLTNLGRAFLDKVLEFASAAGPSGPRPVIDLAHLNEHSMSEALGWFEAEADRRRHLLLCYSHGAIQGEEVTSPHAITLDNLTRLRALGGLTGLSAGPRFHASADSLRRGIEKAASIPFRGRAGYEGIGIGTDFLHLEQTIPPLETVTGITRWLEQTFGGELAAALAFENARGLLTRAAGAPGHDQSADLTRPL